MIEETDNREYAVDVYYLVRLQLHQLRTTFHSFSSIIQMERVTLFAMISDVGIELMDDHPL